MPSYFRLAEVLRDQGVSQSELARRSGVSFARINRICAGKATAISLGVLDKLALALGVSARDLIGERPTASRKRQGGRD